MTLASLFIYGSSLGLRCYMWAFSCNKWGLLSSCSLRASHGSSFSCGRAWALGCMSCNICGTQV